MKSPFKFLDAYAKEDKDIFFGRDDETEELYDRVFETNLILLYGGSGTGKTSLINCGLGNMFENTDWLPLFIRRGENLITSFHRGLDKCAVTKLKENASINAKVKSLYLDHFKPIYLIFDQFEEIFIMGSREEQLDFFETIKKLLEEGLQCKVLISMREEYIAHLSEFELMLPYLFDNRQRIEKMSILDVKAVIQGTAGAFDIELEPEEEVTDMIIEKLKDKKEGIDLANLQVYLDRLYREDVERKNGKATRIVFDPELIEATGQLEDVMSEFLDEQIEIIEKELADKGTKNKGIPLSVLFALVTDNGTKRNVVLADLQEQLFKRKNIKPDDISYCVKRFQEMRILRELS